MRVSIMESERLLRFLIILSDSSCVKQNIAQTSAFSALNNSPVLANPAVVLHAFEYARGQANVYKNCPRLLVDPSGRPHPLVLDNSLNFLTQVALKVSRRNCFTEEFPKKQPNLLLGQE